MSDTPTRFTQALAGLLPPGFAWPREPGSTWMRVLTGVAGSLEDLHDVTEQATREWLPHTTHTRLEEWEEATGLPDPCFGPTQTVEARRAVLLSRLRRPDGTYADSSATTTAAIEAAIAHMGYVATVRHNTRMRCGRDRVGHRVGVTDGRLYVLVAVTSVPFAAGVDRVGSRLVSRPPNTVEMACAIERLVPARFEINVVFT